MTHCKVFVNEAEPSIVATLSASLYVPGVVVEVCRNKDATGPSAQVPHQDHAADFADVKDGFLLWPVVVELETEDDGPAIVAAAADLLRSLWDAGHPAVAACDFEEDLPWGGGIQRVANG
jgi:hypothetical protein